MSPPIHSLRQGRFTAAPVPTTFGPPSSRCRPNCGTQETTSALHDGRLARPETGRSDPQIAGVSGHSLRDVKSILEKHYLGYDRALGEAAIHKLEARTNLQSELQSGPLIVAVD